MINEHRSQYAYCCVQETAMTEVSLEGPVTVTNSILQTVRDFLRIIIGIMIYHSNSEEAK